MLVLERLLKVTLLDSVTFVLNAAGVDCPSFVRSVMTSGMGGDLARAWRDGQNF